ALKYRPVCERVKDYAEVAVPKTDEKVSEQASRCMDCGTPFCHWACPLNNLIPEWNDHAYRGRWQGAFLLLDETNVLPEVTGRVCPALCESACVLGVNDSAVTIRDNELAIIEKAFKEGYIKARKNIKRTGKKAAVIGSGPAGISAAYHLNRAGHSVTVYEKENRPGGFMRYGIPDFKLEKSILDRRINLLKEEGIIFKTGISAGTDIKAEELLKNYDAICVAAGCRKERDLAIPGRELAGIHQAVSYLKQSNMRVAKDTINGETIFAEGKKVVVIGGGDTGADCVGTANRQGALCVVQIEIMPKPPETRPDHQPWPKYPMIFKTSTSHEEGSDRQWSVLTKSFYGENGKVKGINCVRVEFSGGKFNEIPGSDFKLEADLVLLAMGFTGPVKEGLIDGLGVELDARGNVKKDEDGKTSVEKVFAAGDVSRGPSLIVWAIAEGKKTAAGIDRYLKK
ncbi:MAG TPA: glutamate synthase subunit beta, partial [Candidatus Goldiibacteriota bacterium]|nr:glutamate synthase subunit beta [Candidatus Goldiibacteriota bacterium]